MQRRALSPREGSQVGFAAERTTSAPPGEATARDSVFRTPIVANGQSLSPRSRSQTELGGDPCADFEEYDNATIASGKVIALLMKHERGSCEVETKSVYGCALAMPQIARSAGWPRSLTHLALRSYIFLAINIFVQAALLYLICFEEMAMDKFSGQMYLCDFGQGAMTHCPEGEGCKGPTGTKYTPSRLYGWKQWTTRRFAQDALKTLFPEKLDEITARMDPGEYGLESYSCRILCCFLFMMAVMNDFSGTLGMFALLWHVPTDAEPWITDEVPQWATKEYAKAVHGQSEIDLVSVKVAGMPLVWKVISFFAIFLPKLALWKCTVQAGTTFLMETSGIEDLIVNSIALLFILNIDEMICETFITPATQFLMDRIEGYRLYNSDEEELWTDRQTVELVMQERDWWAWNWNDTLALIPARFFLALFFTYYCLSEYYRLNCVESDEHTQVSRDMYLPLPPYYSLLNFLGPNFFSQKTSDTPFWVMPRSSDSGPTEL